MILCCGEALIDMIPTPTVGGGSAFQPHSGGAVFNTAIALGRLGAPAAMLTALSRDMFGTQLLDDLAASKVDTSHIIRTDRPSTLAFVELRDGQARYAFFDENTAERMIQPADLPPVSRDIACAYFGGISLAREPGAAAYAGLAARLSRDRVIMLDPNIRTSFVADEAGYRERLARIIACADIVKVSDEDLDWIMQGSDSLEGKVARLRKSGPRIVVLTRGADGATAWHTDGDAITVPVRKVDVVDTVGAGDTFNAGFLADLHAQGLLTKDKLAEIDAPQLERALGLAAQVAAVTVSRAGANSPWRDEL